MIRRPPRSPLFPSTPLFRSKTTTARFLARARSCGQGPTADPCGTCEACVEIAEGRDMDVLEIDAATYTGIDNVREVIIAGLGILPVRNRYKVFIIDEVHQLSVPSFNALLKSIEEPPPHVIFMMATTAIDKIPETVLSRSQVYEFRTISAKAIADQLRRIVDAEGITVGDESLQLIARDAEGSMRDAQSKLDQVIAFTGTTITGEDVATVLGLVGRDLLLDVLEAVADEDAPAAFALAARAVEMGLDLRAVCRRPSRVARRAEAGAGNWIAGEGECQGCIPRRDPQDEAGVLQHRVRAGAEDRRRRRSRHVHVLFEPAHAAEHVRAESRVAGNAGAAGGGAP